jgi:hypothetical protein
MRNESSMGSMSTTSLTVCHQPSDISWHAFSPAVQQPNLGPCCLTVEVSRSHTVRSTPGRTPRNEQLARDSGCYLYNTNTNIHTLSWIRTHDPRNQAASDLHLRHVTHVCLFTRYIYQSTYVIPQANAVFIITNRRTSYLAWNYLLWNEQ